MLALLTWAFVREKVHLAQEPGLGARFYPRGFSGSDSCERIGAGSASMNMGFIAPPDAYKVRDAVDVCGSPGLVKMNAKSGSIPDWVPCPHTYTRPDKRVPLADPDLKDRKGRPLIVYVWTFKWTGDLPEIVAERRATYRRWAEALRRIHADLSGRLVDHELSDVLPPLEPWKTG